jgi:hypothetical protein
MNLFQKATKKEAKLRMAIAGPSGSGKTFTALSLATALGPKVALLDTEHGSASKYADLFDFDTVELEAPFHPDRFIRVIEEASKAGYDVLVIDSLSHAWSGPGGLLEEVDNIAARKKTTNSFAAWKDATPIQNRFIEAMLAAKLHLIVTMRSKQEYVQEKDEKTGKTKITKLGLAPIQRDGVEYEFDVFTEMDLDNRMIVSKTRCSLITGAVIPKPGAKLAETLAEWLKGKPVNAPPLNGKAPVSKGEVSEALYAPQAPEKLSAQKASDLHKRLGRWGWQGDDQKSFVAEVIGREVESFTELTKEEATKVFVAAEEAVNAREAAPTEA